MTVTVSNPQIQKVELVLNINAWSDFQAPDDIDTGRTKQSACNTVNQLGEWPRAMSPTVDLCCEIRVGPKALVPTTDKRHV